MNSCHSSHVVGDGDFTRVMAAGATAAAELTQQVRRWLERSVRTDAQRCADIVLAVYEALSNCADHAYRGRDVPGTTTLAATYDAQAQAVRVCVTDHGAWRNPASKSVPASRGRGLMLMRALTDELVVDGSSAGTTVCLHFERCVAPTPTSIPT